mgnify:CR=1 FL=1
MDRELLEQRKQMLTELVHDKAYVPMKAKEIAMLLNIPKAMRGELQEVLDELVSEGKLGISKKGKYGKPETFAVVGTFTGHARGFGFVTVEGMEQDVFIPEDKTGSALNGDKVQIVIESEGRNGRRAEGTVLKVLEHANSQLVGYYQKNKNFGFVIPDDQKIAKDIFIPQGCDMGAVTGHKVVVKVTDFGDERKKPEGRIKEILGHVNDPGTDILSLVRAYNLPEAFPEKVMKELEHVPDSLPTEGLKDLPEGFEGRKDLRDLQTVTIDGEDAKDLDDAVSLTMDHENYILGVHIADVSNYVQEHSALDTEALKRGTSVYLVDRVIPMLPHALSNGICSLNQGEERLALSCIMTVNPKGEIIDHTITESVICVDRRMTYTNVKKILADHDPEVMAEYEPLVPMFEKMTELAAILRKKRMKRGSIDFDFPETKVILDKNGNPVDIRPYDRNVATKLIEDFMLAANETVAAEYYWRELPFVYRTHEQPDSEKIQKLSTFINNFGYSLHIGSDEVHPKELQKLLEKIDGTSEEPLISRLTLRSMKQARYTVENTGHFGLAADCYCHFTSPIRRYPDLQIHRIIKEAIHGELKEKRQAHYEQLLPQVAVQTSALERRAEEAERETEKLKKCEYMAKHIGETFEGVISGVSNWGFYVELPNTVEGLVRISELRDDYYIFDEQHYELVGEMTRKTFKLGQPIRVQVASTDRLLRTVDFILPRDWDRSAGKGASV